MLPPRKYDRVNCKYDGYNRYALIKEYIDKSERLKCNELTIQNLAVIVAEVKPSGEKVTIEFVAIERENPDLASDPFMDVFYVEIEDCERAEAYSHIEMLVGKVINFRKMGRSLENLTFV